MPHKMNQTKLFLRVAPVAFALCAGVFLIPAGRAQPAPQIGEGRFLFIFDTSAEMKKRLPAVQTEVKQLLATSLGGQLHSGDSIGVWTFNQDLNTAQFPQQRWMPEDAVTIVSDINKFVGKQRFTGNTRFAALQPRLNQVIQDSGRLTVLIFSDGGDEIKWTPYDAGINQVFKQRQAEQKRTQQPFVLVFRTQSGQYAGCTMNFPPGMVSIPDFPPPPAPPAPTNPPPPAPPPAPVVKPPTGPPVIIIGTTVETNWPPAPPPPKPAPAVPTNISPPVPTNVAPVTPTNVAPAAPTNPVAPPPPANPAPAIQTNAAPAPPANPVAPTNSAPPPPKPASVPPPGPVASTNTVASPPENSGPAHKVAFAVGGALLVAAVGLAALAAFRSRRIDRSSLITRSMRKD